MTTLKEYFEGDVCEQKFSEGDVMKINDETIEYMVVRLESKKFAFVRVNSSNDNGYSCSSIINTKNVYEISYDELSNGIKIGVRKLTDVKTGNVYTSEKRGKLSIPFGKVFKGNASGVKYTLIKTRSANNTYVSMVNVETSRALGKMVSISNSSSVSFDEMKKLTVNELGYYSIVE